MQIDMTRPNTARILDYWMGGVHNFEIDRQLGDQAVQAAPIIKNIQQRARQTLARVVRYFIKEQGLSVLIDFGAGLPTCDNTHIVAAQIDPVVRVLYNDIDPLTVYYGKEILDGASQVRYVEGDAQYPLTILDGDIGKAFLQGERRVGILYMALAHLMSDDQVAHASQELYDWAAPGSFWFLTHATRNWETDPALASANELYKKARVQGYLRMPEELLALLAPWRPVENGITLNQQWGLSQIDQNPTPPIFGFEIMVRK